ncbi:MAG: hypothetical protein WEA80_06830 [Gemmatimonadaceae bacterium]
MPHDLSRLERYFRSLAREGATLRACYETVNIQGNSYRMRHHADLHAELRSPSTTGRVSGAFILQTAEQPPGGPGELKDRPLKVCNSNPQKVCNFTRH